MISSRLSLSGRSKEPRNLDSEESRQESCDQQVDRIQRDILNPKCELPKLKRTANDH